MYREDFNNNEFETETYPLNGNETFTDTVQSKFHDIILTLKKIVNSLRSKAKDIYAGFLRIVANLINEIFKIIEQVMDYVRNISELIETVIKGLDKVSSTLSSLKV